LNLKEEFLFLQKKVLVCEDCYLFYNSLKENKEKSLFTGLKKPLFIKNTSRIARKVQKRLSFNNFNNEARELLRKKEKSLDISRKEEKTGKKWDFKLNLKNLSENRDYFNSERSTGRITSTRSRELTERYSNSQQFSEYFIEENQKFRSILFKKSLFSKEST